MRLRWLSPALSHLDRLYEYIARENPRAARHMFTRIRAASQKLERFPYAGRIGQVPGTRELVVTGLPYLIVYRVAGDTVEILRVFHASQERSNSFH